MPHLAPGPASQWFSTWGRSACAQLQGSGVIREVTMIGWSIPFDWAGVGYFLLLIPARPGVRWCHLNEVRRLDPAFCSGVSKTRSCCKKSDLSWTVSEPMTFSFISASCIWIALFRQADSIILADICGNFGCGRIGFSDCIQASTWSLS